MCASHTTERAYGVLALGSPVCFAEISKESDQEKALGKEQPEPTFSEEAKGSKQLHKADMTSVMRQMMDMMTGMRRDMTEVKQEVGSAMTVAKEAKQQADQTQQTLNKLKQKLQRVDENSANTFLAAEEATVGI